MRVSVAPVLHVREEHALENFGDIGPEGVAKRGGVNVPLGELSRTILGGQQDVDPFVDRIPGR